MPSEGGKIHFGCDYYQIRQCPGEVKRCYISVTDEIVPICEEHITTRFTSDLIQSIEWFTPEEAVVAVLMES